MKRDANLINKQRSVENDFGTRAVAVHNGLVSAFYANMLNDTAICLIGIIHLGADEFIQIACDAY